MWLPKGWGDYPLEYNREIHGPYNPSMYYGKRDTPFGEVKLKELGAWLSRRNKTPKAISQAISRAWFKYYMTWVLPKYPGGAFIHQIFAGFILINFVADYKRYSQLKWCYVARVRRLSAKM